ncbi:MAG: hypothetical protein KAI59_01215 [Planctomycetes bacterium]|nr:hypothetical protein [Planctomycetota bacterium]
MKKERIENLLRQLAHKTDEPVGSALAENIKNSIPKPLRAYRHSWDTINIMIDLRVSKLAAAAAIIITMLLTAKFINGKNSTDNIYQDSKLLVNYCLSVVGANKSNELAGMPEFYEHLVQKGKKVTYYADDVDTTDSNAVLMHWELPDGRYGVILGDFRSQTVTAEKLIELQSEMLKGKAK